MMNRTASRNLRLLALLLSTCLCGNPSFVHADDAFPTSPLIDPVPLDETHRKLMDTLIRLPVKDKERPKVHEALCPERMTKPLPGQEGIKAALAIVDSDISVEVKFEKGAGAGKPTEATDFSVYLEFAKKEVLIRSSLPRFASDAAGVWVPFPPNFTRFLWTEGKKGSDLLFLLPEVQECGVQAVAICPRTYVPRSTLALTTYVPTATRYFVSGKSDGLFAVNPGEKGKIQASIRASKGIALPEKWLKEDTTTTPSATMRYSTPREERDQPPPFIPAAPPILGAIESRLSFGEPSKVLRSVVSTSTIEISQFDLGQGEKTIIRGANLNIEPGPCFLVTKWREQNL